MTTLRSPYICPAIGPTTTTPPSSSHSANNSNHNNNANINSYNNFMLVAPTSQQDNGNNTGNGNRSNSGHGSGASSSSSSSSSSKTRWCVPIWGLHLRGLYQAFRSHTFAIPPPSSSSSSSSSSSAGKYHIRMLSRSGQLENEHNHSNLLLDFKDFSRALAVCARGTTDEMLTFLFLLFAGT